MTIGLPGAAVLALLTAVAFIVLFRRLAARGDQAQSDLEWCRDFSVAKYRPMERLFVEEDYDFLASQPGFHPRLYRKLQAQRRKVFRHYLRCLSRDFEKLSNAAKLLLLDSQQDRPDLAAALMKQKLIFRYAMFTVQCRLVLQGLGLGTVDVRPLVESLEGMRNQLRQAPVRA